MTGPAWERFSESLRPKLYRVAARVLGDEHEAEDAIQEALIAAWLALPSLRDFRAAEGWLLVIVRNEAVSRLRRLIRQREVVASTTGDELLRVADGLPDRRALLPQQYPELGEAIERLTPLLRRTLEQELGGATILEIAAVEGISYSAAKVRVHRARTRVREALRADR